MDDYYVKLRHLKHSQAADNDARCPYTSIPEAD